jgi:hypothetical protein
MLFALTLERGITDRTKRCFYKAIKRMEEEIIGPKILYYILKNYDEIT